MEEFEQKNFLVRFCRWEKLNSLPTYQSIIYISHHFILMS